MSRALGDVEISGGKKIAGLLNEPEGQTVAAVKDTEFVIPRITNSVVFSTATVSTSGSF